MTSYKPGRVLMLVGLPLSTVCPFVLWDGWTALFIVPLCPGVLCLIVGAVLLFLRSLTAAADAHTPAAPDDE